MSHLAAFLALAVVVIVTPGPDTALTIRNSLLGGRRGGISTGGGVATGLALWALAAAGGVAALLQASRPAFLAVRAVGAAYLVYLGLRALREATRRGGLPAAERERVPARLQPATAYRQGVFSNLSNPKIAVFFISLLPQFVDSGGGSFAPMLALGLLFSSMTFFWLTAYAFVVARVGAVLRRPRVRRLLDAVTGAALVAFGLRLAAERR
jgi:threonine/homoserine/homoserine lactone efflux protein